MTTPRSLTTTSIAGIIACAMMAVFPSPALAQGPLPKPPAEKLPEGVIRVSPSELKIDRPSITPGWIPKPLPQGEVDLNPPWLHVSVPVLDGNEATNPERKAKREAQKWKRRYYFKLSQDPTFTKGVLQSEPKRWSFFNPYRKLPVGTWYWTYGVARAETPDKPVWSKETYSFIITGREYSPEIPPSPEQFLAAIKKRTTGPITTCFQEDIGNLLPTQTDPELAKQMLADCEKAYVGLSKQDPPSTGPRDMVEWRRVHTIVCGYIFTGDQKYKDLALKYLSSSGKADPPVRGELNALRRPEGYKGLPGGFLPLDMFYNELSRVDRLKYAQHFYSLCDEGSDSPDMHEAIEHQLYDNHGWQGRIPGLIKGSVILCRYDSRFDDWVKYGYELYLYRAPAFSRTDGGSSEGNGYLGVHDDPLTDIPWLIYRLTGYNLYQNKLWFQNFARYMAMSNPAGNPGISFEDAGVDGGSDMQYLTEALAYMRPDNPWNLWQHRSMGRRDNRYFSADLAKGSKALDLLAIWRKFPKPDTSKMQSQAPREKAAAFGDVGLVCMHTDLTQATNNLMLSFRAGPYGSEGHTHPAQNAFTVAYGGQELFWRTGYYNGGGMHNIYSYKSSQAHNTIAANGMMQGFSQSAFAWIARFANGERISYALGDASNAYNGKHHYFTIPYDPDLKSTNKVEQRRNWVEATAENGFGNPGVKRFRRHMVMLRPHHILIYDELEAATPIPWTFQLHSKMEMTQLSDSAFKTANEHALGGAQLFCASPVKGALTDQFVRAAVDEENKRKGQNPPNWHATITTKEPLKATRFLTVISVSPQKGLSDVPAPLLARTTDRTQVEVGDYAVTVELDPSKPSYLEVHDRASTCALVTGQASQQITVGGKQRIAQAPGSTLLWESQTPRGEVFIEKVDQMPDVLRYGNPF